MTKNILAVLKKIFNFFAAGIKQAKENPLLAFLAIVMLFHEAETVLLLVALACLIGVLMCLIPQFIKKVFGKIYSVVKKPFVALKNLLNRATEQMEQTL